MGIRSVLLAAFWGDWVASVASAVDDGYRCGTCGRTYDRLPEVCHACGSVPTREP